MTISNPGPFLTLTVGRRVTMMVLLTIRVKLAVGAKLILSSPIAIYKCLVLWPHPSVYHH